MRRSILSLAAVAVLGLFMTSCNPDVIFTGTDNIVVDLGSTDADVLEGVEASNGADVTVTGIDYDKAGEHNAIFTAKDETKEAIVKIKTDKLIGSYEYTMTIDGEEDQDIDNIEIKQSSTVYNKILVEGFLAGTVTFGAICNGNDIEVEEFNVVADEDFTAKVTGTGVFEKIEGSEIYAVKTLTLIAEWSDGETEEIVLNFTKL